jgi:hypothetical protein
MNRVERIKFACELCGREFERLACQVSRSGQGRFCSKGCMEQSRKHGSELTCQECGARFYRRYGEQYKAVTNVFCCRNCYMKHRSKNMKRDVYPKRGATHIHRINAEMKIGRKLRRGEVVHHIDGNRHNCHPDNLQVLSSQAEHAALHGTR